MNKKKIGILTIGRTDYSYFKPILRQIERSKKLEYYLIAAGMHLSEQFGYTCRELELDGFVVHEKLKITAFSNTPEGTAKTMGMAAIGSIKVFNKGLIDLLLVLGDRYETLGVVCAAIPYNIPIAHIGGGDVTEGSMDEQMRHAITKAAHIHFPTNRLSARRIVQMGEESWRVLNAGSTSIDMMKQAELYSKSDFFELYKLDNKKKLLLVTFHPVTLEPEDTACHVISLINSLKRFDANIIITYPNSDHGSGTIIEHFNNFARENKNARFVKNLGIRGYYSAMKHADVMIGNSSSGIIESATFMLPVVNIGDRQKNRLSGRNVINSPCSPRRIISKTETALSGSFRDSLKDLHNPYGNGNSSGKVVNFLEKMLYVKSKKDLITKKFCYRQRRGERDALRSAS